jgi:methylenetetrahydrofolate--tRNA-(uracil-5-)-methyltransferase
MFDEISRITVVGGGLAGVEAAWQIAQRGIKVCLYEMRPAKMTPAHTTDRLAELVCSNSLGADQPDKAPGLLKQEMRALGSLVLACAEQAAVPAGSALAVDRERFAQRVTEQITAHPLITVIRQEVTRIPDGVTVIASGPLTSDALAAEIARLAGTDHLYFWDAIAPIVTVDSIDFNIAFRASRYGGEADGDYINCPMTRAEYEAFVEALLTAETATLRDFELRDERFFEGCLPIEVLARRGKDALAFGPLRPVGLRDPRTGKRPYAVVQLRQDNVAGTLYNLVGFQTNLKFPEQDRVFRLIPGLQNAEFVRYGQDAPQHLHQRAGSAGPYPADQTGGRPAPDLLRRPDRRRGGLRRQRRDRPAGRDQRRPRPARPAAGDPAAHHHARRALPLRDARRP